MPQPSARHNTAGSATPVWLLLLLSGVGAALRIFHLGAHELRGDESFGLLFSAQPLADIITQTLQFLEPHPPLDYVLLHFWTQAAGDAEWALRFTSAAFSILAIPLIYQLGKQLDGPQTGLWAALLFAASPFQVWHAQEARMYAISTTLGLAASIALLRAERHGKAWLWIAFVLLSVANAYTHYYALFILVAQGLYWLVCWRRHREQWKRWVASQVAIVLLYLPWLIVGWRVLTAYHGNGDSPAFFAMLWRVLTAFSIGQTFTPGLVPFVLPLIGLVFILGWVALLRQRTPSAVYLALYLCVPVLAVYISSLSRPVFNERYLTAVTPPFFVVMAAGLAGLPRLCGRRMRIASYILGTVILCASLWSLYGYFCNPEYTRSRGWRELAGLLDSAAAADDVIVQNYPDPTMWYYYRGATPHTVIPAARPLDAAQTIADLEEIGMGHERVWFVPYKSADWDATGFVTTWLDRHWERVSEEEAGSFALRLYRPIRVALADTVPTGARWEEQIGLRAYRIEPTTRDHEAVSPGEALNVTLFWQALQRPAADYTAFVHLLAPSGEIIAQRDSQPLRGTYPTSTWEPDEVVLDRYVIIIPAATPSGQYTLAVGLYDAATGTRLQVLPDESAAPDERYALETITVN